MLSEDSILPRNEKSSLNIVNREPRSKLSGISLVQHFKQSHSNSSALNTSKFLTQQSFLRNDSNRIRQETRQNTSVFKFLGLLTRNTRKNFTKIVPIVVVPSLTPLEIRKKFRRAKIILGVIHYLNQVSVEIVKYGTSSNLYDLSTRDRPALQRYLFPLTQQQMNEKQLVKFPMIHPNSLIRVAWNPILIILIIYTATLMPYRISFLSDNDFYYGVVLDQVIDTLFWTDLGINFLSTFYDEEGKLINQPKEVITTYLKGWFLIDFLACFPFEQIFLIELNNNQASQSNKLKLVKLARLPRLYRLIRMAKVVKLFKYFGKSHLLDYFEFNSGITRILSLFITVLLMVHLFGCMWHFLAKFQDYDPDTWVYRNGLENSSNFTRYIASIYYAFTALTTVGYGDIHAKSAGEIIVTILWMIVGVGLYSYTIGLLASVLAHIDYKAQNLSRKKAIMNEFCNEKNISKALKDKLKLAIEYNFDRNPFTWADKKNMFTDLPIKLRYDIMMQINGGIFANIQLFKINDDKAFVVKLIPLLKPVFMHAKQDLWQTDAYPDAIYFLTDGRVNFTKEFILNTDIKSGKLLGFKSMISGSYFGETEILFNIQRQYTVVCEQSCEFYYLTRENFENDVAKEFPHIVKSMLKIAKVRQDRNSFAITQLQDFINSVAKSQKQIPLSINFIFIQCDTLIGKNRKLFLTKFIDAAQNISDYDQMSITKSMSKSVTKRKSAMCKRQSQFQMSGFYERSKLKHEQQHQEQQLDYQSKQVQMIQTIAQEVQDLLDQS